MKLCASILRFWFDEQTTAKRNGIVWSKKDPITVRWSFLNDKIAQRRLVKHFSNEEKCFGIGRGEKRRSVHQAFLTPITPQAMRPPALPVFFDSGVLPRPRSSSFSCTTTDRPTIDRAPVNVMPVSWKRNLATLPAPPVIFPTMETWW